MRATTGRELRRLRASPARRRPRSSDTREQVADPRYAYQMVTMLQGVVERGTGDAAGKRARPPARRQDRHHQDFKDTWFVGFSPDLVAAVWVGYDQPRAWATTRPAPRGAADLDRLS